MSVTCISMLFQAVCECDFVCISTIPVVQLTKQTQRLNNLPSVAWLVSSKASFESEQFMPEPMLPCYRNCSQT